jgi:hypothetical protein
MIILAQTINKDNYSVTNSIFKRDLFYDNKTLTLTKDNFDMGFTVMGDMDQRIKDNI